MVNSLYPYAMMNDMPIGNPIHCKKIGNISFCWCVVRTTKHPAGLMLVESFPQAPLTLFQ